MNHPSQRILALAIASALALPFTGYVRESWDTLRCDAAPSDARLECGKADDPPAADDGCAAQPPRPSGEAQCG